MSVICGPLSECLKEAGFLLSRVRVWMIMEIYPPRICRDQENKSYLPGLDNRSKFFGSVSTGFSVWASRFFVPELMNHCVTMQYFSFIPSTKNSDNQEQTPFTNKLPKFVMSINVSKMKSK